MIEHPKVPRMGREKAVAGLVSAILSVAVSMGFELSQEVMGAIVAITVPLIVYLVPNSMREGG